MCACPRPRARKRSAREGSGLRATFFEGARSFVDYRRRIRTSSLEAEKRQDVPMHRLDGPVRIDQVNPLVLRGQRVIPIPDLLIEVQGLSCKAAFIFQPRAVAG